MANLDQCFCQFYPIDSYRIVKVFNICLRLVYPVSPAFDYSENVPSIKYKWVVILPFFELEHHMVNVIDIKVSLQSLHQLRCKLINEWSQIFKWTCLEDFQQASFYDSKLKVVVNALVSLHKY